MPEPAPRISRLPQAPAGQWVHVDAAGINAAIAEGYERALNGDWQSGSARGRLRAFRGLVVERAAIMAELAGSIIEPTASAVPLILDPTPRADAVPERAWASSVLYQTAQVLELETRSAGALTTEGQGDTGALPAIAVVAIVVVSAVAVAYCADRAAEVVDRHLSRRADLQSLSQVDAQVMQVVRAHLEHEQEMGEPLPLDDASKAALEVLREKQGEVLSRHPPALRGPVSSLADSVSQNSTAALGGFGLGVGLLLLAALYFGRKG